MRHTKFLVLLTASAMIPATAAAQPVAGPYVSLGAGVNLKQNDIVTPAPTLGFDQNVEYSFHPGFAGQASAGFGFWRGLRAEIEGDYLSNVVRGAQQILPDGQNPPRRGGGLERQYGGFVNVLYDFDFGMPVHPYLGVGAGGQAVEHTGFNQSLQGSVPFPFPPPPPGVHVGFHDQTVGGFAYQGIAGFSVPVPWVAGLSFTADYRFIGLLDPLPAFELTQRQTRDIVTLIPGLPVPDGHGGIVTGPPLRLNDRVVSYVTGNRHFTNDFNHQIVLGFRYALFQPNPPMPAAAAPQAPPSMLNIDHNYLVFFDWNRSDLSAHARAIIAAAATATQAGGAARLEVDGYTDLSGTASYNQRLSVRRAISVKAELVRDGVPAGSIAVIGHGESSPLVPTAPGVREPQNRRVEIIFH